MKIIRRKGIMTIETGLIIIDTEKAAIDKNAKSAFSERKKKTDKINETTRKNWNRVSDIINIGYKK